MLLDELRRNLCIDTEFLADEKFEIITRGLQEVLGGDAIKAILAEGRSPKGYWGASICGFLQSSGTRSGV